jgi:hypothetical protein
MVTDEGHIITKNPLPAPFVVKGTKMWRKLGAWFWLATQNLADFPGAAQTMLNMVEWWICLNMPPQEIEEVARFKQLSPAQKALLLSASKEPRKYTEGVVFSKKLETLFYAVPPSHYLALAMTEPEEKAERFALMQEHGCSELEAAFRVAERMCRAHVSSRRNGGRILSNRNREVHRVLRPYQRNRNARGAGTVQPHDNRQTRIQGPHQTASALHPGHP